MMRPCFTALAVRRAQERYGIDLSPDDLREMLTLIQNGQGVCLHRRGDDAVHVLTFRDVTFNVGMRGDAVIVTFMPANQFRAGQQKAFFVGSGKEAMKIGHNVKGHGPYKRQKVRLADLRRDSEMQGVGA